MSRLIILSNRCEPYTGSSDDMLFHTLSEISRQHAALWFGWNGNVSARKRKEPYRQIKSEGVGKLSWDLSPNEYDNFYQGYIHNVLWPVFHNRPDLTAYKREYFITWKNYNNDVKNRVSPFITHDDVIWVHDYHLLPVAKMLQEDSHRNKIGFFLHQPFPPGDVLRSVPEHDWLFQSLLHYDCIGFQSSGDINNFISYALRHYRAGQISKDAIKVNGRIIKVCVLPCGIDKNTEFQNQQEIQNVRHYHRQIIISNDIVNEISGVDCRLNAMKKFLALYPQYLRDVSLLQISDPSGEYPASTGDMSSRLERLCGEINGQYGDLSWYPVNYIHNNQCSRAMIFALYNKARVAMFTPLSEGMSLGAKEFILAQNKEDPGVLLLSEFTGAAEMLTEALMINPYDAHETSEALHSALTMPLHERKRRHSQLLNKVNRYDCHWWATEFLACLRAEAERPQRTVFRTSHHGTYAPHNLY